MRIIKYFLIIIVPLVIALGNFRYLVFNTDQYQKFQEKAGVYINFQDQSEVTRQTNNLIGYYRGKNELDHNFFSYQAIFHLNDVKYLISQSVNLLYTAMFTMLIGVIILVSQKQYKVVGSIFLIGSLFTATSIALLALGLFAVFDPLFTAFHKISFKNDLWLFPENDNLIKLFPQEFFILFANTLARNTVITCLIIIGMSVFYSRFQKNKCST